MRMVFVNSAREPGGGPTSAVELTLGLVERGHDVTVACHPRGAIHDALRADDRLRIAPVAIRAEMNPYRVVQLARLNRALRPDLVLADRRKDLKLSVTARWLAGDHPIVHRHGAPSLLRDGPVYRYYWGRHVSAIIVNSHVMRERQLEATPWLGMVDIHVIHNGKDVAIYRPMPDVRASMRASLGIPAHAFVAAFHGVLQSRKQVHLLLRAVAALDGIGAHALIIGDGPARAGLEAEALAAKAPATFTGLRTDIPELLAAADVAVNLAVAEGFSNSVVEAMACGLPVIVSDATSHPEQVEQGVQGVLVPAGDPSAVADALRMLAAGPETRERMGVAARARVTDRFDRERMLDAYERVLRGVRERHERRAHSHVRPPQ